MAGMVRKLMRNIRRSSGGKRTGMTQENFLSGTRRAGMHQKNEHEYMHAVMAEGIPEPVTADETLDIPEDLESEIPPKEEKTAEEVADGTAVIVPDESISEEIQAEEEEALLSADYSGERIPELQPLSYTDRADMDSELIYSPGDSSLKEITEPLPGLGERNGIPPRFPATENPSANVPAQPEIPEGD